MAKVESISADVVQEAISYLDEAVRLNDRDRIDAEVENLVSITTDIIAYGDTAILEQQRPEMERVYSAALVQDGTADERADVVAGQLRLLTALFTLGAQRRRAVPAARLVESHERIFKALANAEQPMTNQAVAAKANLSEEQVARVLPQLRAAGLVETQRQWRDRLNSLTPEGRKAAGQLVERKAQAVPDKKRQINISINHPFKAPGRTKQQLPAWAYIPTGSGQSAGRVMLQAGLKPGKLSAVAIDTVAQQAHRILAERIHRAAQLPEDQILMLCSHDESIDSIARKLDASRPDVELRLQELNLALIDVKTSG
jgi:DNA-binding MarR family transcriptional regulator